MTTRGGEYTPAVLTATWWEGEPPEPGAFLRTSGGSAYRIEAARELPSGSYRLDVTRWPNDDVPDDALVYRWEWSKRDKRAGRRP